MLALLIRMVYIDLLKFQQSSSFIKIIVKKHYLKDKIHLLIINDKSNLLDKYTTYKYITGLNNA